MQHTATHCNTLQRTTTHHTTLQHIVSTSWLQHAATRCSTLPRATIHHNKQPHISRTTKEWKLPLENHIPPSEWVMSHMNESCHKWIRHITYECTWMSGSYLLITTFHPQNESCHIWMSHFTYEWAMSRMNESRHIWMSHVTHECKWMSHVTHECTWMRGSCLWPSAYHPQYESCHICMSHVFYECVTSHMNESRHIWRLCL